MTQQIPLLAEAIHDPATRLHFARLVRTYREAQMQEDHAKTTREKLKPELLGLLATNGVRAVQCSDWTVAQVEGHSSTINRERLLERGVDPEIIAYATMRKPWVAVQVREAGAARGTKSQEAVREVA